MQKIELLGYENLINIFIGFGFNYPNMNLNEAHSFFPILEDDLFILQLVTMYGAIPLFLFIRYLFFVKPRVSFNLYNDKYWLSAKAIIICALITAFHTNAIIRPQIFPIFFFYIVMADQIVNFYRVQDNRK